MQSPWILLAFSAIDKQVDLKFSPDAKGLTDPDEVLNDFVIPILVKKQKGVTENATYEAALYNGSTRVIADVATAKGVKLTSLPEEDRSISEHASEKINFWKWSFYAFIGVTLFVIVLNLFKRKK